MILWLSEEGFSIAKLGKSIPARIKILGSYLAGYSNNLCGATSTKVASPNFFLWVEEKYRTSG